VASLHNGDVLRAVRLLYRAKIPWRQIRFFVAEEMGLHYPSTQVLGSWEPDQPDRNQRHLVEQMIAVNESIYKFSERIDAKKAAQASDVAESGEDGDST